MTDAIDARAQFKAASKVSFLDQVNNKRIDLVGGPIAAIRATSIRNNAQTVARLVGTTVTKYAEGLADKLENTSREYSIQEALAVREYLDEMVDAMSLYAFRLGFYEEISERDEVKIDLNQFDGQRLKDVELFKRFSEIHKVCMHQLESSIEAKSVRTYNQLTTSLNNPYVREVVDPFRHQVAAIV